MGCTARKSVRFVLSENGNRQLESRILSFQSIYGATAKPFTWKFFCEDLKSVLAKLGGQEQSKKLAA